MATIAEIAKETGRNFKQIDARSLLLAATLWDHCAGADSLPICFSDLRRADG
ncbi:MULTISPECIES: hypothetical protein [Bradyrhizobium]|uniref:hypothetical protein n=1 Tax=Bradyrhizobium TaxID=374 RepID=UPI001EDC2B38|nr:hypothetical protein [Bradyrhizobium zhengyangense]MCG2643586.1 hypothetical protein [Bradyrhizobium zhengyangense]